MLHSLVDLHPRKKDLDTHWTEGWVALRGSLDAVKNRKISAPARVKS